jgi:hypothetical protein
MIERGLCYLYHGHWVRRPPVHPEAGLVFYWKDLGSDEGICKEALQY